MDPSRIDLHRLTVPFLVHNSEVRSCEGRQLASVSSTNGSWVYLAVSPELQLSCFDECRAVLLIHHTEHGKQFDHLELSAFCFRFGQSTSLLGQQWMARRVAEVGESSCFILRSFAES